MTRRELIADAGVRLIARSGAHGLTHLLVDAEAQLPRGSTSYYARTRRDLIALVVQRLSEGSQTDIDQLSVPDVLTREEAARVTTGILDRMAHREDAQAARFTLLFELRHDDELRAELSDEAPVRAPLIAQAENLLRAAGIPEPQTHAVTLVGLVDALLMYRASNAAPIDAPGVLRAYFLGLPDHPPVA